MKIPKKYVPTLEQAKWCGLCSTPKNTQLFYLLVRRQLEEQIITKRVRDFDEKSGTACHFNEEVKEPRPMRWVLERQYPGITYGTDNYASKRAYVNIFQRRWRDLIDQVCDDVEECDVE